MPDGSVAGASGYITFGDFSTAHATYDVYIIVKLEQEGKALLRKRDVEESV